jgi:hypothetical protein
MQTPVIRGSFSREETSDAVAWALRETHGQLDPRIDMLLTLGGPTVEREVMWASSDGPGLEHLRLALNEDEIIADGEIITTMFTERPLRIDYWIRCDAQWRVREVRVAAPGDEQTAVNLRVEGAAQWATGRGGAQSELDGCIDVDIIATPFTNTLPIRRLSLHPGESKSLRIAYITVPDLKVVAVSQRYTCLESGPDSGLYRFESLESGYTNELPVDADGLVIDYPGIWRRVWPIKAGG